MAKKKAPASGPQETPALHALFSAGSVPVDPRTQPPQLIGSRQYPGTVSNDHRMYFNDLQDVNQQAVRASQIDNSAYQDLGHIPTPQLRIDARTPVPELLKRGYGPQSLTNTFELDAATSIKKGMAGKVPQPLDESRNPDVMSNLAMPGPQTGVETPWGHVGMPLAASPQVDGFAATYLEQAAYRQQLQQRGLPSSGKRGLREPPAVPRYEGQGQVLMPATDLTPPPAGTPLADPGVQSSSRPSSNKK